MFWISPEGQKQNSVQISFYRQNLILIFGLLWLVWPAKIKIRFCPQNKIWTKICFCFCFCPSGEIQTIIKIFTIEEIWFYCQDKRFNVSVSGMVRNVFRNVQECENNNNISRMWRLHGHYHRACQECFSGMWVNGQEWSGTFSGTFKNVRTIS